MPLICPYCNKEFKLKNKLQSHFRICSTLSNNTPDFMYEDVTIKQVYKMLQLSLKKQEIMETKIKKLERTNQKITKNINIISFLNENVESLDYYEWIKNIEISKEELYDVIAKGFSEGVANILTNADNDMKNSPLKAFNEKSHLIYINNNQNWEELTNDTLKNICLRMVPKLLDKYIYMENDIFADKTGTKDTEKFSRIRLTLYGNGKIDIHVKAIKRKLYLNLKSPVSKILTKKYI
ncbi:MAG: hypothetical protein CXT73_04750 [Methanobacteriota archaeon]|nr:MAG: hypothetical protein CXT73_04750 [Euryarchaeota archaeon]